VPKTLVVLCLTAACTVAPGSAGAHAKAEAGGKPDAAGKTRPHAKAAPGAKPGHPGAKAAPGAKPGHPGAKAAASADPIIARINAIRRSYGLRPYLASASLSRSAARYSRGLMRSNRFTHDSVIHAGSRFERLGEALAYHRGWRPRRGHTVRSWLHSATHRALLLSRSFRYVGAGVARGRFGGGAATIWTLQLGSR
jgi:uncharacterized protein YkwD